MRGRIKLAAMAASALTILGTGAAQAAVITYVYEGTVAVGEDYSGVFGPADRWLDGLAFRAVFRRDTSVIGADLHQSEFESSIEGDDDENPITASLTIDGVTWDFRPEYGFQGQEDYPNGCGLGCDYEMFSHEASAYFDGNQGANVVFEDVFVELGARGLGANVLPSSDFRTLPSIGLNPDLEWFGGFEIEHIVYGSGGAILLDARAGGVLDVETLTVLSTAVPEPATWALMITGFGGAGAMLRRRRAAALA